MNRVGGKRCCGEVPGCRCGFEVDVEIKITDNDVADVFFVLFVDNEEDICHIKMQIEMSDSDVRFRCHSIFLGWG